MKRRADKAGQQMTGRIKAGKGGGNLNVRNIVRGVTGPINSHQILTKSNKTTPISPESYENTALGENGAFTMLEARGNGSSSYVAI